jgi:hypothetical protein
MKMKKMKNSRFLPLLIFVNQFFLVLVTICIQLIYILCLLYK